jgi:L-asparaginase
MNIAEVCIVFGNKIVRANRAVKNHESFVDVFHSPTFPLLGEIERPIRIFDWANKRHKKKVVVRPEFDANIELVRLFPGMSLEMLIQAMKREVRGLVIQGFGPGNIPSTDGKMLGLLEDAVANGMVVVISSQMEKSVTNLHAYEVGYKALEAGVLSSGDMTNEATITKLMWALAQSNKPKKVAQLMTQDIAGEITV